MSSTSVPESVEGKVQPGADMLGPFLHSLDAVVSSFSAHDRFLRDADSVVPHPDSKVARISQLDIESRALRVLAGVTDRLVSNAIHFVANDRVHVASGTLHGEGELQGVAEDAILAGSRKGLRQIVPLRGGSAQGGQRCASFLGCLRQPFGDTLQGPIRSRGIGGIVQPVVGQTILLPWIVCSSVSWSSRANRVRSARRSSNRMLSCRVIWRSRIR